MVQSLANSVRALYDYAIGRGLAEHNPAERVALPEASEADEPAEGATGGERPAEVRPWARISDRVISLGLQLATLVFVLIALVLLAESLSGA